MDGSFLIKEITSFLFGVPCFLDRIISFAKLILFISFAKLIQGNIVKWDDI
jgi:hypothetical protein